MHAFQKNSTQRIATPATRNRPDKGPFEEIEGDVALTSEKLEVVRGSGNVFRDLGPTNTDAEQFKAILAAEIIKALDRDHLTVPRRRRIARSLRPTYFSRIRSAVMQTTQVSLVQLKIQGVAPKRPNTLSA